MSNWQDVNTELPDSQDDVLVTVMNHDTGLVDTWIARFWASDDWEWPSGRRVWEWPSGRLVEPPLEITHWQEMPQPALVEAAA